MRRTSTLPSLRVHPALRKAAERVLEPGETLSAFLEVAVRETIDRREEHNAFVARGLASRERAKKSGDYVSSDEVLAGLETRLAAAKRRHSRTRR